MTVAAQAAAPLKAPDAIRISALIVIGAATAMAGLALPWIGLLRPGAGWESIAVGIAASAAALLSGLIAWRRQPANPVWRLFVASFFASFAWELVFLPDAIFYTASLILPNLGGAIVFHLLVAFPTGHIRGRYERAFVGFVYVYALLAGLSNAVFNTESYTDCAFCRSSIAFWPDQRIHDTIGTLTGLGVPVLALIAAAMLWRHWRYASGPMRRVLTPVAIAAPVFLATVAIGYTADAVGIAWLSALVRSPFWEAGAFILPLGFLAGVMRLRATRAGVASAIVDVGALPSVAELEGSLRRHLGDPSLRLLRWSVAQDGWFDGDGRPAEPPAAGSGRSFLTLDRAGTAVAGLDYDAAFDDPALESTVRGALRLAVDATELRDELRAHGGDVTGLPTGEVTFLFADIEGSTELLERLGGAYAGVLDEVRVAARGVAQSHGGRVVDALGDGLFLVFGSPSSALSAAMELTHRMAAAAWPAGAQIKLRIGLHTGTPELTRSGYVGLDVHRAARVMSVAAGGEVVASMATVAGLDPGDASLRALGRVQLKGISEPMALFAVEAQP